MRDFYKWTSLGEERTVQTRGKEGKMAKDVVPEKGGRKDGGLRGGESGFEARNLHGAGKGPANSQRGEAKSTMGRQQLKAGGGKIRDWGKWESTGDAWFFLGKEGVFLLDGFPKFG